MFLWFVLYETQLPDLQKHTKLLFQYYVNLLVASLPFKSQSLEGATQKVM